MTVVGVLVEVPVMLIEVAIVKATKQRFENHRNVDKNCYTATRRTKKYLAHQEAGTNCHDILRVEF